MDLNKENKTKMLGASVTESFYEKVNKFVDDRNWKLSAFIRVAIEESMDRVEKKENK